VLHGYTGLVQVTGKRFYVLTRDAHLYAGLFLSPFVVVFAASVIFLVHAWIPGVSPPGEPRVVSGVALPADVERLSGRAQVDALRPVLDGLGVRGEVGFVRRIARERRIAMPVSVPGREITVDLDVARGTATIAERRTGLADATVFLHKMPGPHNVNIRGNAAFLGPWRWLADATVYSMLFLSASGVYLWAVLKAERRIGLALVAAGAVSFFGVVYAITF
jgi:hypothetical protein